MDTNLLLLVLAPPLIVVMLELLLVQHSLRKVLTELRQLRATGLLLRDVRQSVRDDYPAPDYSGPLPDAIAEQAERGRRPRS